MKLTNQEMLYQYNEAVVTEAVVTEHVTDLTNQERLAQYNEAVVTEAVVTEAVVTEAVVTEAVVTEHVTDLTNQEMLEQYNEAVVTEHVTDLTNLATCTGECDECPAQPACAQLAYNHEKETSDYETFVTNFKKHILPLIPIKE